MASKVDMDESGGGRRRADRRQAQKPFAGENKRKRDRRDGSDRRTSARQ